MTNADDYNAKQLNDGALKTEHVTALVKHWQASTAGLEVDGMAGPKTIASIEETLKPNKPTKFLSPPLRILPDGRKAVVTNPFRPADQPDHDGVDMLYPWRKGDKPDFVGDHGAAGPKGGPPTWGIPAGTIVFAGAAGVVQLAGPSKTGYRAWIDHRNSLRSGHFHLTKLLVKEGDAVMLGDPIGVVGDNPSADDPLHLHFEVSPVDTYAPLDPELYLIL